VRRGAFSEEWEILEIFGAGSVSAPPTPTAVVDSREAGVLMAPGVRLPHIETTQEVTLFAIRVESAFAAGLLVLLALRTLLAE
jgi:hypothetical protein